MRRLIACAFILGIAALAAAGVTPGPAVTDANVAARVHGTLSPPDNLALAHYYQTEAKAEAARIDAADRLLRAYNGLEGKVYEPLKAQARKLLRAARESRKRYELLAAAHQHLAFAQADDSGPSAPTPRH